MKKTEKIICGEMLLLLVVLLSLLCLVVSNKSKKEEAATTLEMINTTTPTESTEKTTENSTATTVIEIEIPSNTTAETSSYSVVNYNNVTKQTEIYLPPRDLESEYANDVADLKFAYNTKKYDITTHYDNLLVENAKLKDDLENEKANIARQCDSATSSLKSQLASLQAEKSQLVPNNPYGDSYYDNKIKQYDQQISSLNNQIAFIESQYQGKINDVNSQIRNIPSAEEIQALKEQELRDLDNWYNTELANLNTKYGK